jgi:hypothetical protein
MTKIAVFLQAKEPLLDNAISQMEAITGKKGVDVRLAADIAETTASKIKELGYESDVTGPELYHALLRKVAEHDEHLAKKIGGNDPTDLAEMIPLIVKAAESAPLPKNGWFLKTKKAQQMLKDHPPTAVMERLGYHLVSQLLEKEDIFELMLSLRFAEDADWLNAFDEKYKQLVPGDFEERGIKVVVFDPTKWGDIAEAFIHKKRHNITHSKEMGAIAVMPITEKKMVGVTLKVMPLLFHYFNEIRLYSSFFKLMQTKKNFGQIVASTLIADTPNLPIVKNGKIGWRVIQRYFAKLTEPHPEIFEPHLQPEDLHWRRAEEVLYEIDPELEFWRGLDFVATDIDGDTITFSLMDVSLSYSNGLSYGSRYLYHFRESLWNELFVRYLGQKELEEQLLIHLDSAMVRPETL